MQDNLQYLTDPNPYIWYEKDFPIRTDANEVAAPSLKLRTQIPTEPWQKIPYKQIVNVLAVAQSASDGIVCAGCGRILEIEFMELDHMTPKADRGVNDISNRILLCRPCNGTKRDGLTMRGLIRANKASGWLRDEDLTKQARKTAERTANYVREEFGSDDCDALCQADTSDKRALAVENLRHILYTL